MVDIGHDLGLERRHGKFIRQVFMGTTVILIRVWQPVELFSITTRPTREMVQPIAALSSGSAFDLDPQAEAEEERLRLVEGNECPEIMKRANGKLTARQDR